MSSEYSLDTSLARHAWQRLDAFTRGYVETAMWTLTDDDGNPADYLGLQDIAPETLDKAIAVCRAFQDAYAGTLALASEELPHRTDEHHGHDFWLTRNGHGVGFWDRGYSRVIGDTLTRAAKVYGEVNWYIDDDGIVWEG